MLLIIIKIVDEFVWQCYVGQLLVLVFDMLDIFIVFGVMMMVIND